MDSTLALVKQFAVDAAPALKAAFIHAAKIAAYIVLSTAITAAYSFIEKRPLDPAVFFAVNLFLASAKKAIDEFGKE